jgi:hypothetical protein
MTHQEPDISTVECFDIDKSEAAHSRPTAKQLEQWSDLVAQGEVPIPSDLTPDEFQRLLLGVARRRRKWLVKFIADAIAQDIVRSQCTSTGDAKDVEANI